MLTNPPVPYLMTFALMFQFHVHLQLVMACLAFNQEKALVRAFSVIANLRIILFEACSMAMTMLPCCHCCDACYCFRTRWGSTKALLTTWWPSPVIRSVVVMLQAAAKISHSMHEGITSKQKHFSLQTTLELSTGLRKILQRLERLLQGPSLS